MAITTKSDKKTPTQKITEKLVMLREVSAEVAAAEELKKLTDNEKLRAFVDSKTKRGLSDIAYLRKSILHQAANVATEMSVEAFEKFADGLGKLIS